jgi:hypothetical protein
LTTVPVRMAATPSTTPVGCPSMVLHT